MFTRQTLKSILWYACSIFIFWNAIIAIRAYRFTHYNNVHQNTTIQNADLLGYIAQRLGGSKYYKLPIKQTPAIAYETIQLTTTNNLKLEGWHLKQLTAKGTCIVFHGLAGNREQMMSEINGLYNLGYNVLAIDFRAHGNSQGTSTTVGLNEAEDVKLAYDFIKNKGEKNIVLYGASMGAASISACLQQYPTITPNKVVLDMPFESYSLLMERFFRDSKYPKQPTFTLFTFWNSVYNQKWLFNMKPSEYVKAIKCPVLLQWGKNDQLVPEESTQKIYDNITSAKKLIVYQNSEHESFAKKEPETWKANVTSFLQ
jgi:alpha-beta hydrolase superfamily lysophospholipase